MRKFTIVTSHGRMDFIKTDKGSLELKSVGGRALPSQARLGKLGDGTKKVEATQ